MVSLSERAALRPEFSATILTQRPMANADFLLVFYYLLVHLFLYFM